MEIKKCCVCKLDKTINEFYKCSALKSGISGRCKSCDDKARRKWRENNPERSKESARGRNLKCKYGITIKDYEFLLASQGGVCGICGWNSGDRNFCVDHDHSSGKIRGLLCNNCNRGLGLLGDTHRAIELALEYLQYHDRSVKGLLDNNSKI